MTAAVGHPGITTGVDRRWVLPPSDTPAQQCHASSVLSVDGRLLCAWFAGTAEGTPDNRIWLAAADHTGRWQEPRPVAGEGTEAHWNPVLAAGPDGSVWLFYKRGPAISAWQTWVRVSRDAGRTWSGARELVPGDSGGRGPVKNPPVLLPDGGWLAPGSEERWLPGGAVWDCFADRSDDGGTTWAKAPIPVDRAGLSGAGVIQPSLWTKGGTVGALMRSSEGFAYAAESTDGGRTFSPAQPTNLPNNNSGLTVAPIGEDLLACVHNPVAESWGPRCPLAVSFSTDGTRWGPPALVLEDGRTPLEGIFPAVSGSGSRMETRTQAAGFEPRDTGVVTDGRGEYSYPSATLHGDQLIVTYTWQRRGIVSAALPLAALRLAAARAAALL